MIQKALSSHWYHSGLIVGPLVASCPVSGPDKKSSTSSGDMARSSMGTPCGYTGVRVKLPPAVNERSTSSTRDRGLGKELVLNGSGHDASLGRAIVRRMISGLGAALFTLASLGLSGAKRQGVFRDWGCTASALT